MRYLNILKKIEIEEKRRKKLRLKLYKSSFLYKSKKYSYLASIVSVLISIISLLCIHYLNYEPNSKLYIVPFLILIFSYASMVFCVALDIYSNTKKIISHTLLPFCNSINLNIKTSYIMDNKYFKELLQLDLQVLEIGKIELKKERSLLEKRIGCIVGPLDKLGILPGVLSTMAILSTSGGFNWVSGIAYAYIILMLISFTFYPMIMRYNRMIELTELAIQFKNEQLK